MGDGVPQRPKMDLAKAEGGLQHGSRFECARMMEFVELPALESKYEAQKLLVVHEQQVETKRKKSVMRDYHQLCLYLPNWHQNIDYLSENVLMPRPSETSLWGRVTDADEAMRHSHENGLYAIW